MSGEIFPAAEMMWLYAHNFASESNAAEYYRTMTKILSGKNGPNLSDKKLDALLKMSIKGRPLTAGDINFVIDSYE